MKTEKTLKLFCLSLVFLINCIPLTSFGASSEHYREVQKAYIAYYGRPADPGGLEYWADKLSREGSLASIIQSFGNSQEFRERFGSLSYSDLVNNIYIQLFNRNADEAGRQYYVSKLQRGEMTLQTITLNILYGAQNEDKIIIDNKVEVAEYFTQQIKNNPTCKYSGNEDIAEASKVLSYVNETKGSVNMGKLLTDYRYCRVLRCPSNTTASLDALSRDQKAFIASRGNPHLFYIMFASEEVNDAGKVVYTGKVRRLEKWMYNTPSRGLVSVLFDNGYFVREEVTGPYARDLTPTYISPAFFTPCTTKKDVISILGEPSCENQIRFGGRIITVLRYNPTNTLAANSIYLENDLVVQVEGGYSLTSPRAGADLCRD